MTLLADLDYFPPIIFYLTLRDSEYCIFDQYEPYRKMTFLNRCVIPGANGAINLSIPVTGGRNQRTPFAEVRIMNREPWQPRHWKTIESVYNKSPWFDHYRDELGALYHKKEEWLVDWNRRCFEWITAKMSISTPWELSVRAVQKEEIKEVNDWRHKLRPSTISAEFPDTVRYPQVFADRTGFLPHMSALDYLFCVGNRLPR